MEARANAEQPANDPAEKKRQVLAKAPVEPHREPVDRHADNHDER
jgi:hypothetical protein